MKSFRCYKCEKAISSLKNGMIQWKHNPALNQASDCQIIHLSCGYNERELLLKNCFIEELLFNEIVLDNLKKRWEGVIYQGQSFKNVMIQLDERI